MQEGFPNDETWVSCDGGHHGFYMYQCFANVMQALSHILDFSAQGFRAWSFSTCLSLTGCLAESY